MFSANCDETKLVKRLAEGQIAADIRKRMNVNDDAPVYLTELGGIARIGDLTWENFAILIVEGEGEEVEFETFGEANNFVAFLKWLDEK